jgi:methylmalonyl-CoA mutase cobalamin-binding domain/chain
MSAESSRLPTPADTEAADAADAPLRFVTAASLFDGHDAAINMIRRLLQSEGAEVVHLGHNRSVADIVRAAIDEDADGIAVSSYQGGHNEYFAYMVDMLRERGCEHIRVVVGGGGTIAPQEIEALERHGSTPRTTATSDARSRCSRARATRRRWCAGRSAAPSPPTAGARRSSASPAPAAPARAR